jgi:Skp family chaperone for outer membrane proteins
MNMDEFQKVHLQWFAEEEAAEEGEEEGAESKPKSGTQQDELDTLTVDGLSEEELKALVRKLGESNKKLSLKSRELLREVMEKKTKLRDVEKRDEEAREKALKEKEEFKKLFEDLKPKYEILAGDVAKTLSHFETELIELKAQLPEQYHKLIPKVDVRDQVLWIREFVQAIPAAAPVAAGAPGSAPEKKTVGAAGSPPGKPVTGKDAGVKAIEDQIRNCKSADELAKLLRSHGGSPNV